MPSKRLISEPTLPPVDGDRELMDPVAAEAERDGVLAALRGVPIWYMAARATLPMELPVLMGAALPVLIGLPLLALGGGRSTRVLGGGRSTRALGGGDRERPGVGGLAGGGLAGGGLAPPLAGGGGGAPPMSAATLAVNGVSARRCSVRS